MQVRPVDDVIVEQGCRVDELDRGRQLVMASARIVEEPGAGERQHGPHPLPSARDQMTGKRGDQRDFRLHSVEDGLINLSHVARDKRHDRVERGSAPHIFCDAGYRCGHRLFLWTAGAAKASPRKEIRT
jgi:hypothetical protein